LKKKRNMPLAFDFRCKTMDSDAETRTYIACGGTHLIFEFVLLLRQTLRVAVIAHQRAQTRQ
jgi:hypothetical protein